MNHDEFVVGWQSGLPETPCGAGSRLSETTAQREWLPRIVEKYGILDIADIGAGDLNWMRHVDLPCAYRAYDLVPRHSAVRQYDLLTDPLPDADCLMVLWVLNHMTRDQAIAASAKLMRSKSRFLITTHKSGLWNFIDSTVLESCDIGNGAEIRLIEL